MSSSTGLDSGVLPAAETPSPPTAAPLGAPAAPVGYRRPLRSARPPQLPVAVTRLAAVAWALGTLAYASAVLNRSTLAVVSLQAGARFGVGPALLSMLAVVQLTTYAGMQIPVGTILDRLGSRRLIGTGALLMSCGEAVFAVAPGFGPAVAGRIMIGLGDAMTFLSVARVTAQWFPRRRVALFVQLTGLAGGVGSIAATVPLAHLLGSVGWSPTFLGIAVFDALVALVVLAFLPERSIRRLVLRDVRPAATVDSMAGRVRDAWAHPGTRLGLWVHFTTASAQMTFSLLWGYPYLVQAQGLSPVGAATLLLVLNVVSMGAAPIIGQVSATLPRHRLTVAVGAVAATAVSWTAMLAWPGRAPLAVVATTVVLLAVDGPVSMAGLDIARTHNPVSRIGTVTGIANVGGYSAALVMMLAIGAVLEVSQATHLVSGPAAAYRLAFAIPYLVWAIGLPMIWRARRRLG